MKKDRSSIRRIVLQSFRCGLFIVGGLLSETMTAQNRAVVFDRDFSPAEGLVIPQEMPERILGFTMCCSPFFMEKRFGNSSGTVCPQTGPVGESKDQNTFCNQCE